MKKLLSVLMAAGIFISANAQKVSVQAGLNLANITRTNDGQTEKNNILPTFNVGFLNRFGLSSQVDLEAGLLVSGRGSKAETYFNGGNDYVKSKFNPLYLELPANLLFMIPLDKETKLLFNAGPYVAYGFGGKSKQEAKIGPLVSTSESNIKFNNDDPFTSQQENAAYNKLKRFDYGINVGAGIEFNHLIFKANYGFGLAKINSTENNNNANDKNKYRTLSFSVAIPLWK